MFSSTLTLIVISTCCIYFTCTITFVYGRKIKCEGKWATHFCFGGNGKRSGPPIMDDDAKLPNERQQLYRQLADTLVRIPDNYEIKLPAISDNSDSLYPETINDFHRKSELEQVQTILGNLLSSRRRHRDLNTDRFVYDR